MSAGVALWLEGACNVELRSFSGMRIERLAWGQRPRPAEVLVVGEPLGFRVVLRRRAVLGGGVVELRRA